VTGVGTCVALELRALCARRLTQVGAVLAFATALVAGAAALRRDPGDAAQVVSGWRCLAWGMGPGMTVAAVVALLLGSQALAAAAADGSLRATLCRPVSRSAVLAGHATALAVVGLALGVAVLAGAAAAGLGAGYGDVAIEYAGTWQRAPEGEAGLMARRALLLAAGAPLTIATAAWCGLAVSTTTDHPGVAAGAALLLGVPLGLAATLRHPAADWLFLRPGLQVWAAFADLAEGYATAAWDRVPLGAALLVPAATMALAAAFAFGWFARRDVLA
jgi:hypothetical protein